jgi:hypothetical protein
MLLPPVISLLNQGLVFTPISLPGLAAWYDASDSSTVLTSLSPDTPATDGQTVRRWLDKSGNGRHLDQEVLASQPSRNSPGLLFGSPAFMQVTFNLSQPYTAFCLANAASTGTALYVTDGIGINNRGVIGYGNSNQYRMSAGLNLQGGTQAVGNHLFACIFDAATSILRLNGSVIATGNTASQSLAGVTAGAAFDGLVSYWPGKIDEVIYCTGILSAENLARVERYLARKRGITLP